MNFQLSPERIARLEKLTLPADVKSRAVAVLGKHVSDFIYLDASAFLPVVQRAFVAEGVAPPSKRQLRLILERALGKRDGTAEKLLDDGQDIADTDLRDFENVPLKDNWRDYFAREVLPLPFARCCSTTSTAAFRNLEADQT